MKPLPSSRQLRPSEVDRLIRQVRSLRRRWSNERAHVVAPDRPEFDEIIIRLDPSDVSEC